MAIVITPGVNDWIKQTDAFTIVFKGYDDNGERCRGELFSIQYGITYDGTMPDPLQMTREYSDASGLIALTITKPCVISIFGEYTHDVNDISKGTVIQEIATNYSITFQPIILSITAIYNGPDIPITEEYNAMNLSIQANMSDGTIRQILPSDCIINDYTIYHIGNNNKVIYYLDTVLNMSWPIEFNVIGIPKLLSIEAIYIGERHIIGDRIYPDEVAVYATYILEDNEQEQRQLLDTEWFFIDIPIINDYNDGVFTIGYKDQTSQITVPYDKTNSLRLNVWYEGAKIEVGKSYSPENVVVYIIYPDGEKRRIDYRQVVISSYLVEKEGWNWFTVTYTIEFRKITQQFPVEGIILKHYVDLDFKVLYIEKDTNKEIDYTSDFKEVFLYEGVMLITWDLFLSAVNKLEKYGLYIATIPKLLGLSNEYDMEWEVLCINKTTLKATISKIYKEEENNG